MATENKNYNWTVNVRVVRETNGGWTSCIVDTPTFHLLSNVGSGSIIGSRAQAERMVHKMFAPLLVAGDELIVSVYPHTT